MSTYIYHPDNRPGEQGNVLFLILIAVVLFAALSYAVTRSNSNGTRGVDNETSRISTAQLIQYPAGIRTSIIRMVIGGISVDSLRFDTPENFASVPDVTGSVFHPKGGGATHENSPVDMMANNLSGTWYYNAAFEIENIGLSQSGNEAGNDVVAFLPGIKKGICAMINENQGLGEVPDTSVDLSPHYKTQMINGYTIPATELILGAAGTNGTDNLTGYPFGCFQNQGGEYVYYHVLADR